MALSPIGGLFFSTYHKAMFFFSNPPTHLPEEPFFVSCWKRNPDLSGLFKN
jgi:hypothetical protein